MKKRIHAAVLTLTVLLMLTACSGGTSSTEATLSEAGSSETERETASEAETSETEETTAPAAEASETAETETIAAETEAAESTSGMIGADAGTSGTVTEEELERTAMEGLETKIQAEPLTISLACSTPSEGTLIGEAFNKAIEAVSEWTDGNVVIRFYSDGMVGNDAEIMEGLQVGILDAVFSTPTSETEMMPDLAVLDIGGLYSDVDMANQVIGQFREEFESIYSKAGFHLASIYVPNFRVLSSNQPIRSAEDLKDLKIRTQDNASHMTFWNTMGCTAVPLEYSDLSMALERGVVDAEENPVGLIVGSGLDKLQSYIVKTEHIPFVSTLVANQKWYEGLSEEQKLVFDQFAEYTERYIMAGAAAEEAKMYAACEAEGILVTDVPEDIRALYPAAARAVIDELKESDDVDADLVDRYVKTAGFDDR